MFYLNRVSIALFVVLSGGTGLFGSSLFDDIGEVRSVEIESFSAESKINSIVLAWTMKSVVEGGQFQVLRSESFGENYELLTAVSSDLRFWIDYKVEIDEYYYYRLLFTDHDGNTVAESNYLPQFAKPMELPNNIEKVMSHGSNITSEDVIISTVYSHEMDITSVDENEFTRPTTLYDLFCKMVLDPILFGSDMETRNNLIWLDASSQSGLAMRMNMEPQVPDVLRLQVYDNFTSYLQGEDESSELPLAIQLEIVFRLEELADSDYPGQLIDEYEKFSEIFRNRPVGTVLPNEQWIAPDRNNFSDLLDQWLEQLYDIKDVLGEDNYPLISEIGVTASGEIHWIEFLAMGGQNFQANEYSISASGEEFYELPDEIWKPGLTYVIPFSELNDNLRIKEIIVVENQDKVVDDFIIPSQLQEGSISRDLRGDIWLHEEPSPNRLTHDTSFPILINEYAVMQETDRSELLMEPVVRSRLTLEILSIESDKIDLSSRLRIDFGSEDVEPMELTSWNIFDEFSTFTVDCPDLENPLFVTLQLYDSEEGWIDLQHLILKPSELVHKSRIPDGAVWIDDAPFSFGESNSRQSVGSQSLGLPEVFALYQNFPNPFNYSTTIKFDLLESAVVTLVVIDATGREVAEFLLDTPLNQGQYNYTLSVEGMSSGIYFVTLKAVVEDNLPIVDSRKMIFLK